MSEPTDSSTGPDRGLFIVFEGGDGTGKSTQAARLAERLGAVLTREPGGTSVGSRIRSVVLDPDHPELADRTEALLMAADRAQHVAELIGPALESGRHVVSDRYVYSSLAYQGAGRGLGVDTVRALNDFGTGGLEPDLVLLLEVDPGMADDRMGRDLDRIEASGRRLAELVSDVYREFAEADEDRWAVIDASGSPDEVEELIRAAVFARLAIP